MLQSSLLSCSLPHGRMSTPLPPSLSTSELLTALGTVALFLPVVIAVHRTLSWLLKALVNKAHAA
jgi:hypothetical protein